MTLAFSSRCLRTTLTARADTFLRANPSVLIVSDFAAAEFSSVIARHVRTKDITKNDARIVFSNFDVWTALTTQRALIAAADIIAAEVLLRRLDLTLRTPDALNIAIAQRMGATLVTFDKKMAAWPAPSNRGCKSVIVRLSCQTSGSPGTLEVER